MGDVASYGIGASVLGSFSDRFGRKKMIILAIAMLSLFHVSSSYAETYIGYTCLQWAAGKHVLFILGYMKAYNYND